jgi:uncharacterized cofD-like protein
MKKAEKKAEKKLEKKNSRKGSLAYRLRSMALPGLKRWILIVLIAIFGIVFGVLLLLDVHPVEQALRFALRSLQDTKSVLNEITQFLPARINGIVLVSLCFLTIVVSIWRILQLVIGAYFPDDQEREAITDVLYRRKYKDREPRVVVIGGGTGLSNLLKGLKRHTNNITAIVTVGDDGGSSGRLRQELGVLPPGDIRNCITALADEDQLVTELFRYRFHSGEGLEGHSFGNLFLTAVCAITNGDMIQAVRTASRVLNSCGQVLPSTLDALTLVANYDDGTEVVGESHIPEAGIGKRISLLSCLPANPTATAEAVEAILSAELIVLGPGSLYTSIIPNLLVEGIADAIFQSEACKIYICNVMTQAGETTDYTVSDHVTALVRHAHGSNSALSERDRAVALMNAVLVNDQACVVDTSVSSASAIKLVKLDEDKLATLGVEPIAKPIINDAAFSHHDPVKLARTIMFWFFRQRRKTKNKGVLAFKIKEGAIINR